MEKFMVKSKSFQPGFRFYPTDEELLLYYLKRKVLGKSLDSQVISELDVYKFEPWDLPAMACLKTKDRYWFFFCPRSKKYPSGGRVNRTTNKGYWKSTGNDSPVKNASKNVGKIKTLIFHLGKAPKGERTNWVMHEYALDDKVLAEKGVPHDSYVICKIFEKSGVGPKNGEDYGARFVEEEWDSDTDDDNVVERNSGLVLHNMDCGSGSASVISSSVGAPKVSSPDTPFTAAAAPEVPSPSTAAAAAEVPSPGTDAFVGTPYIHAATSLDVRHVAISVPSSVPEASVERGSALPISEHEVNMLLENFTEVASDFDDVYSGLGDLAYPSVHHIDWAECSDLGFITMSDLG